MKTIFIRLILVAIGISALSSCTIFPKNPDIPVNYFDIGEPGKNVDPDVAKAVDVKEVRTTNPYNERMVFRTSPTHIEIDEYNRWASSPDEMLKKYFLIAFDNNGKNYPVRHTGIELQMTVRILCLESDLSRNTVKLILLVQLMDESTSIITYNDVLSEEQKVDKITAETFAEALKSMSDRMIERISKDSLDITLKSKQQPASR